MSIAPRTARSTTRAALAQLAVALTLVSALPGCSSTRSIAANGDTRPRRPPVEIAAAADDDGIVVAGDDDSIGLYVLLGLLMIGAIVAIVKTEPGQ